MSLERTTDRRQALFARLVERARAGNPLPEPTLYEIPTDIYCSDERFEREREELFAKRPLAIGHESQISKTGDALVHDWTGLPLVTVRDESGGVATFLNVCRHRSTQLVEDQGMSRHRAFVCPYHHWSYGLDGRLGRIPRESCFSGLDRANLNLVSVPTEVRHGLIWVQPSPGSVMDLDAHLVGLGEDLDSFGISQSRFYRQSVREIECDWKLMQDAFLDGYHVVRLHRNTVGKFFPDGLAVSELEGDHVRNAVARQELFDVVERSPREWQFRTHATYSYNVFPNGIFVMHPDYTSHIALYPKSAGETVFVHSMLVPDEPLNDDLRKRYDRSFELIDEGVFESEDIRVSVAAQRGMRARVNRTLLTGGDETALRLFHERLENALEKEGQAR